MDRKKPFEEFAQVWKRVTAARPEAQGAAALMPRKKKRPPIRIPPDGGRV